MSNKARWLSREAEFRIHQLLKLELCNVKDISLIAAPHKIKLAQNTIYSYLCQLKSSFNTILVFV